jgi:hypothetical protein
VEEGNVISISLNIYAKEGNVEDRKEFMQKREMLQYIATITLVVINMSFLPILYIP